MIEDEIEWAVRGECVRHNIPVLTLDEFEDRAKRYMQRRKRITAARLGSQQDRYLLELYGK